MKFLCDVHVSLKLVKHLKLLGYEAIQVNEILDNWNTPDNKICEFADQNDFILITKDSDFRNSFFIKKSPKKLIKINLGNISNIELIQIISQNLKHFEILNNQPIFIIEVEKSFIQYNDMKNENEI
jgi:predicted nuclease of predicted toxin-antitoxin system